MAIYVHSEESLNNMERSQGAAVFKITAVAEAGNRGEDDVMLADGDIIVIGELPAKCNVTDIRMNVFSGFPVGTTIDLAYAEKVGLDYQFVLFATAILVEESNTTVIVSMPVVGNKDESGAVYSGDRGSIWVGDKGSEIAAVFHTPSPLGQGIPSNLGINFEYNYFGTKGTGAYTS